MSVFPFWNAGRGRLCLKKTTVTFKKSELLTKEREICRDGINLLLDHKICFPTEHEIFPIEKASDSELMSLLVKMKDEGQQ